jgi:hypothetical protein
MEIHATSRDLLDVGLEGEVAAALDCVAETTDRHGRLKYSSRTSAFLARIVAARTYGPHVHQLCHLINALSAGADGNYVRLLLGADRLTPDRVRAHFSAPAGSQAKPSPEVTATADALAIAYRERTIRAPFARLSLLAQLFEFLSAAIGFSEIEAIIAEMRARPSDLASVQHAANALERQLYHYLGDRVRSVQSQQKFRLILSHLRPREEGDRVSVDDETIFDFWRDHAGAGKKEGSDFRMFRSVLTAFVNFIRAAELAEFRRRVADAVPVGQDFVAGETDIADSVDVADVAAAPTGSPLAALAKPPADRVKFLTGREAGEMSLLLDCGSLAERLPLSVLRADVFSRCQTRIVQGLRRHAGRAELDELIGCHDAEPYRDRLALLRGLREQVLRLVKATAYVVLRHDANAGGGNIVVMDDAALTRRLAEGREAFQGLSRKGFSAAALDDADAIEAFRAGGEALIAIDAGIAAYLGELGRLDAAPDGLAERFTADENGGEKMVHVSGRFAAAAELNSATL